MANKEEYNEAETPETLETETATNGCEATAEQALSAEEQIEALNKVIEEEKKKYLFLMADFDNFRKRVIKEKAELIKSAKGQAVEEILPIIDDFERGLKAANDTENAQAIKEGMELIYNKLLKFLEKNGVTPMDTTDAEFDEELHEAISVIAVPDESMKKKIIDTVQKGYMNNDKVLRHAKVVVGQ